MNVSYLAIFLKFTHLIYFSIGLNVAPTAKVILATFPVSTSEEDPSVHLGLRNLIPGDSNLQRWVASDYSEETINLFAYVYWEVSIKCPNAQTASFETIHYVLGRDIRSKCSVYSSFVILCILETGPELKWLKSAS